MAEFASSFIGWDTLSPEALTGVCQLSVDLVVSASSVDLQEELEKLSSGCSVKPSMLRAAISEMVVFYDLARSKGWASPMLSDHLQSAQVPEAVVGIASEMFGNNQGRIAAASLSKTLKANQLVDMDWIFGVTASSDSCDEVGKTYLQLKLTFEQEVGSGGRHMHLEMSVDQFFAFLSSMEKCKQYMDIHSN
jgi:hypothetical protein